MKKQKTETKTVQPKFKTNYNTHLFPIRGENLDPVSITVPDESYSLREIVERFRREYPSHMLRMGYYDGEEDYDNFDDVDLTRTPDFDLSDALALKKELNEKRVKKTDIIDQVFDAGQNAKDQEDSKPDQP